MSRQSRTASAKTSLRRLACLRSRNRIPPRTRRTHIPLSGCRFPRLRFDHLERRENGGHVGLRVLSQDRETIFMTGWLGGAIATHVRIGNPLFTHVLFPVYVGVMVWGGLYLRNPRLRALLSPGQPVETPFGEAVRKPLTGQSA
jgi:hypothetical protein